MRSNNLIFHGSSHGSAQARDTTFGTVRWDADEWLAAKWILGVVLIQFGCQIGLLFDQLSFMRVAFRGLSFGVSLIGLALAKGRPITHPASQLAFVSIAIISLNFLHPTTNSLASGLAHVVLNVAIISPIFWVPRLRPSIRVFYWLIAILFAFHVASSIIGVLQVYYPGRFQPALSAIVRESVFGSKSLEIILADGTRVLRPMGLTDVPGGAAMSGLYAVILGVGYFAASRKALSRWFGIAGTAFGFFCIYLSHVRSVWLLAVIALLGFIVFLMQIGRTSVAMKIGIAGPVLVVGSFLWASTRGGDSMIDRFATLTQDAPERVYQANRGKFLESTIERDIPAYPLGAGLGRWGMMYDYFGDKESVDAPMLWVEIQWTAWTYDGGVLLILTYCGALYLTLRTAFRLAKQYRFHPFGIWAALILAYDVAALALTFSYPVFIGQTGFEFWFLNSVLFATAVQLNSESNPSRTQSQVSSVL